MVIFWDFSGTMYSSQHSVKKLSLHFSLLLFLHCIAVVHRCRRRHMVYIISGSYKWSHLQCNKVKQPNTHSPLTCHPQNYCIFQLHLLHSSEACHDTIKNSLYVAHRIYTAIRVPLMSCKSVVWCESSLVEQEWKMFVFWKTCCFHVLRVFSNNSV